MLAKAEEKTEQATKELSKEDADKLMRENNTPPEGYAKGPAPAPEPETPATPPATPTPPAPAPAPAEPPDPFLKLERELAKAEGAEDLKDFSERERGYFYQMRRDRKQRQKAEEERDIAQRKALLAEQAKEEAPKVERKTPEDVLKGKEPGDFLTAQEARELLQSVQPAATTAPKTEPVQAPVDPVRFKYLQMCERETKAAHADFDAVMELADELVNRDPAHLQTIGDAFRRGENPAEVMYGVIKQHPEFAKLYPAAELRAKAKALATAPPPATESTPAAPSAEDSAKKAKEAEAAQAALEANAAKPKTTGHLGSWEGKPAEELTIDEISAMPDREFAKLPKAVRVRYLRQFGSAPNLSK
jgi:hypothetical protein